MLEDSGNVCFSFGRHRIVDSPVIEDFPVNWFPKAQQCTTEVGRATFLADVQASYEYLHGLNDAILRNAKHMISTQNYRAQLRFCPAEWSIKDSVLFRPTFRGDEYLEAASIWVYEQLRGKALNRQPLEPAKSVHSWSPTVVRFQERRAGSVHINLSRVRAGLRGG